MDTNQKGEILIYQTEKGETKIDVYMEDGTIWLTQKHIAQLYGKSVNTINEHIKNIFSDGELKESSTIREFRIVQNEGGREVARDTKFYNLDMILAIGYRVRSNVGVQFRNWTSKVLKEYMQKGFVMNDERLKNPKKFGEDYFDELLERIRDIRASEKRFYQKIKDIYSLSVDYNPALESTKDFFATVQNKLLYAVTGQTAAELITERADGSKDNMGLTAFKGAVVRKGDINISKNYLQEDEITDLNRIVTMFLDHAEDMARGKMPMTMKDWDNSLNEFLQFRRREILEGKGKVSREDMERKVLQEYAAYNTRRLNAPPEDEMIDELPEIEK
ncbi:virulence RhuM family protein [Proteiniborus sp. MB09-C3]|uniref:virulence RhuM family protein n=1 Tax=Proteiniborus sp. MB09-C3 TaxID=3050072 RepID=UPI0025552CCB|nr:virulence RhuM family protein [Proteiniborus sp. MB09-C3]WIV12891.1 virulence RhuM family protein [Proteiniborus sp. MB09-C3]